MRMAGQTQHFVMILLLFSFMISFHTVSASRATIMIHHGQDFPGSETAYQKKHTMQKFITGRMDLQFKDYSGSEANPRHTPKPPGRV